VSPEPFPTDAVAEAAESAKLVTVNETSMAQMAAGVWS
jgi:hypothetical protein